VTLPVVWTRAADSELKAAKAWYETMRPGLGERFALAVETTVTAITENPLRFAAVNINRQWGGGRGAALPYGSISGQALRTPSCSPTSARCEVV
jgi:hypothetical protein